MLLYRMGDFYELFVSGRRRKGARLLDITTVDNVRQSNAAPHRRLAMS